MSEQELIDTILYTVTKHLADVPWCVAGDYALAEYCNRQHFTVNELQIYFPVSSEHAEHVRRELQMRTNAMWRALDHSSVNYTRLPANILSQGHVDRVVLRVRKAHTVFDEWVRATVSLEVVAIAPFLALEKSPSDLHALTADCFDMDVCRLGFSTGSHLAEVNCRAAIQMATLVLRRLGVLRDLRRLIVDVLLSFDWSMVRTWHFGASFNQPVALDPRAGPALLFWERSRPTHQSVYADPHESAGLHRAQLFTERGYTVADVPSRFAQMQALLEERAEKRVRKRLREHAVQNELEKLRRENY